MRCENWEDGLFTVEDPDGTERPLRSLLWYDGPMIFTLPHEGADRLFTCGGETEEGMIYFGASPAPDLVDRLCRNEAPLIDGYRTGPFFRLVWGDGAPGPTGITEIDAFPAEMLPDPEVRLVYEGAETPSP
ncbi:hypothetical protein IQ03_01087 [Gemmobacter caeni]|uniref:Uncharacterized protein n=1 Tax=Gemmobacter caeni TaxID=589035 RepID=A0A2T6B8A5_9RHOB|nr:hypothetical protein [Gemmobacter caeni]PTX52297.1 hypothetical protein C8N34_10275 [Gemmobacter caeni]TWJ02670.1 hypothetical protein IQ03_01087 [Gemmobacter caeni]